MIGGNGRKYKAGQISKKNNIFFIIKIIILLHRSTCKRKQGHFLDTLIGRKIGKFLRELPIRKEEETNLRGRNVTAEHNNPFTYSKCLLVTL